MYSIPDEPISLALKRNHLDCAELLVSLTPKIEPILMSCFFIYFF